MFALIIMAGFLYLFASFFASSTTYAQTNTTIDNTAPTPGSGTVGTNPYSNSPTNFSPVTGVGYGPPHNATGFNGQVTWYKIYIKNGQATDISINQTCNGGFNNPKVTYYLRSMSDQETFSGYFGPNPVPTQSKTNAVTVNHVTTYSCSSTITFPHGIKGIGALRGTPSTVQGHEGYRVFAFWAEITHGVPTTAEQYFTVTSSNGNNQNSYIGMSTPLDNSGLYQWTTIYDTNNETWSASVMFAPRCNANITNTADIKVFDADNGGPNRNTQGYQWSPYMYATLDRSDGRPLNWNPGPNWPITWDDSALQGGSAKFGQSNTTGTLSFHPNHGYLYRLNFIGSTFPNTIQVRLPYDQFDATPIVRNSCAQFSCTATAINANTVKVVVKNDGQHAEGKGYQVRERYYPAGNPVHDDTVVGHSYNQAWPSPNGFPGNIGVGKTRTSTNNVDPAGNPYFYRPAGAPVEFQLYDDTGSYADTINWDNGNFCGIPGTISITCGSGTSPTGAPGTRFDSTYSFTTTNTTGTAGAGYHIVATPTPGLSNYPGFSNDVPISVPIGAPPGSSVPQSVTFSFAASYSGKYTVNFMLNSTVLSPPSPCPPITINPQVSPYFQAWQNDAASGGGFSKTSTPSISCPGNYPAYVSPTTTGNQYSGGIIANSASGSPYQSRSDFGAVALGLIPGPGSSQGFYTSIGTTAGPSLRTWFANPNGSNLPAGLLNSSSTNHCVGDFYIKTRIDPTGILSKPNIQSAISACLPDPITGQRRCQFTLSNTSISGAINIPHGLQLTIYATGNITISTDITYDNQFDPRSTADVPYFALITQGNVTLTNAVTQLNGLYVVQPVPNGSGGITAGTGVFATCGSFQCNNQLVVNGSVTAQHVRLLRAHGSSETLGCTPTCDVNGIGQAPAEIFNFVPSMVIGAPDFAPICLFQGCTEGTYSIAPVF